MTLQAIDGGSNYYASNGFTFAATAGWDDPAFFPICLFLERIDNQTNFDTWVELGLNTALAQQADSPALLLMRANPGQIFAVPQAGELTAILAANGGVLGAETVGLHAADEPTDLATAYQYLESTVNSRQDNRFWQLTFLHTAIDFGDVAGTQIPDIMESLRTTPNATQRHLSFATTDSYFCAGAHYLALRQQFSGKWHLGGNWSEPDMTEAQARRPCRYGDYVRFMRLGDPNIPNDSWFREIGGFPIGTWIETCAPYTENTDAAFVIKPAEINAAVWSTIINGARFIYYFSLGEGTIGDSLIGGTFWQTPLSGETISNYDQIATTDALVQSLASVINSPFAIGYVSVSPAAQYLDHTHDDAGFDVMAKYHNVVGGDNKFYIFAMPRVAATAGQSATFTIANTGATQVTVINESRTISVTGGTTFSDTFSTGNTVHIYRVD